MRVETSVATISICAPEDNFGETNLEYFSFFDIFLDNLPYMKLKAYTGDQQA